jgi:hypothetical protein
VTRKLRILEAHMDNVRERLDIADPPVQDEFLQESNPEDAIVVRGRVSVEEHVQSSNHDTGATASRTWAMRLDPDSGPATIPATCVEEVTVNDETSATTNRLDCISQGHLTLMQAETLFNIYAYRLDHFLYRILGDSPSLQQIRLSSPLLTAAICTVGALHSQELGFLFERCQKAFLNHCASLLFSRSNNIDDIRGLCIGAFWLHEVSMQLIGLGTCLNDHGSAFADIPKRCGLLHSINSIELSIKPSPTIKHRTFIHACTIWCTYAITTSQLLTEDHR